MWEDVLTLGLRLGFGASAAHSQASHELGFREILNEPHGASRRRDILVYPDVSIWSGDALSLLVDAKYKTRMKDARTRIAESDIYEALAFATATGCRQIVLGYPARVDGPNAGIPGTSRVIERIAIGQVSIMGIEIEIQGISRVGALREFAKNVNRDIMALTD